MAQTPPIPTFSRLKAPLAAAAQIIHPTVTSVILSSQKLQLISMILFHHRYTRGTLAVPEVNTGLQNIEGNCTISSHHMPRCKSRLIQFKIQFKIYFKKWYTCVKQKFRFLKAKSWLKTLHCLYVANYHNSKCKILISLPSRFDLIDISSDRCNNSGKELHRVQ